VNLVVRYIRRIGNWMNSGRLRRYLIAMDPDVVVSTHFFASEIIADMKRNGKLARTTLVTVVTDYRLHSWWVAEGTDIYVVAGEDAKKDLIDWHVPAERIMVMGIPIEMVFSRPTDKERIRSSFGLRESLPTVLIIGGGFGVGPIEDIVKAVTAIPKDLQVVVICGHNEELRERISRLTPSPNIRLKAFGFVNNVHEFMSVADLLISKSGGITVSEALARELPLVIIAPIPGQETRNSEVLRRHGAAVEARELEVLKKAVEDLVGDPGRLAAMREAIRSLRRPDASLDVAKLALSKIKK
jgi:processive 1,2-diacylglycerol beta-glucosyltransferase